MLSRRLLLWTEIAILSVCSFLFAQNPVPSQELWNPNGVVNAIAFSNDTIYIVGTFSEMAHQNGCFFAINSADGERIDSFPTIKGKVHTVVEDGSGGWYVGGGFYSLETASITHILADGSVDPNWNLNVSVRLRNSSFGGPGSIWGSIMWSGEWLKNDRLTFLHMILKALCNQLESESDGEVNLSLFRTTLYVGCSFSEIGIVSRINLAAFDLSTGSITDWSPESNGAVSALKLSGSAVYAGGQFTHIGGADRNNLALLDLSTGNATTWDPNLNGDVKALYLSPDTLSVGGAFTEVGGTPRNRIASFETSTGSLNNWDPNADQAVSALSLVGTTLYAGGDFTFIGGKSRKKVAALDTETGLASTWNRGLNGTCFCITGPSGSTVLFGESYTSHSVVNAIILPH